MKKKNLFILSALMLCCGSSLLSSCSDDDNNSNEKTETGNFVINTDDVERIQNRLVKETSEGKFEMHLFGVPLDNADTTVVSVGVDDLAEAKAKFKRLVPDSTKVIVSGDNLTYNAVDTLGRSQGSVYFTPSNKNGEVAVVTFSEGMDIRYVSKIVFVPNSMWPKNDGEKYVLGEYYTMKCCVKVPENGECGVLVSVITTAYNTTHEQLLDSCRKYGADLEQMEEFVTAVEDNTGVLENYLSTIPYSGNVWSDKCKSVMFSWKYELCIYEPSSGKFKRGKNIFSSYTPCILSIVYIPCE